MIPLLLLFPFGALAAWLFGRSAASAQASSPVPTGSSLPPIGVALQFVPSSPQAFALFTRAATLANLPLAWAQDPGLHEILKGESGGHVGIPNYTYGPRARNPLEWPKIWAEIRSGAKRPAIWDPAKPESKSSTATGLGQMIAANVDKYYPSKRAGIGDPVEEAVGMLRYVQDRYGNPTKAVQFRRIHGWY